jgi:hypothetical protein
MDPCNTHHDAVRRTMMLGGAALGRSSPGALKVGWLQSDDISPAAVFLASDAANMVTGAEYEVTAGDSAKCV